MPAPPAGYGNPSGPQPPNNPPSPTGFSGIASGAGNPTGSGMKQCGYDVQIGPLDQFIPVFNVPVTAPCPGNTHEPAGTPSPSGGNQYSSGSQNPLSGFQIESLKQFVSNNAPLLKTLGIAFVGAFVLVVGTGLFVFSRAPTPVRRLVA